jgi:acyl carrier protein
MTEGDRSKIRAYLAERLRDQNDTAPFMDTTALVTTGRLDSMAVIHVVGFLETEFGVDFERVQFDPQRFDTVQSILGIVDEWRQAAR